MITTKKSETLSLSMTESTHKKRKRLFTVTYNNPTETYIPRGNQSNEACEYSDDSNLDFQIVDWHCDDVFQEDPNGDFGNDNSDGEGDYNKSTPDPREYTIRVFGVTDNGHSITCAINGFCPYFFVKVSLGWDNNKCEQFVKENIKYKIGQRKRFDEKSGEMYFAKDYKHRNYRVENPEDGETLWCSFESALVDWEIVKKHDFNAGFTGIPAKLFKFIKLTFKTLGALKQCYWALRKQKRELKIDIYEANLDPHLRFMHIKNILAAGWVRLPANKYEIVYDADSKDTTAQIETSINWNNIEPLERDDAAAVRQLSFDIECYSHEHDKFPIPEHPDNPVIQIGSVLQEYGNPDKYVKHLITLKKCDPIPGTIVICCETEYELLCKWQQLMKESDPDIIYGYNIFGFDLNYLMVRADKLGCGEFKYLGRMKFQQSELEEKQLSSAAYGDNKFKTVTMPGRLQIDLLQIMLRGMTKYPSYQLGYISQMILCSTLKDDPIKFTAGSTTMFVKHAGHKFKEGMVVHLFSMFPAGGFEYEDINKMHMITQVVYDEKDPTVTVGYNIEMWKPATITEWGGGDDMPRAFETKFDLPPIELFKKFASGTPAEIKEIGEYCVQDCMLPQKIINKCNILIDTLEMAKVTYVPTSFLIMRGQQIKVFSLFCKKCREKNYLVHTVESKPMVKDKKGGKEKYKGATVLDPLTGAYWDGVTCLDFKSLYPTTEIDWNLCYTTLVKDEQYLNLPGVKYFDITIGTNTYTYAQNEKGIVPQVLEHLLNARASANKQKAEAKTDFMKDIYNSKQLAFKVTCNSVYGFTGCGDTGMLPCKPIAEATTTIGRGMIEKSKRFSEDTKNFEEVVDCVDWFPIQYYYLSNSSNGKYGLLTTEKVIDRYNVDLNQLHEKRIIELTDDQKSAKPLKVWTTKEFQQIVSFECKPDTFKKSDGTILERMLYKVNTTEGTMLNMKEYGCTTVYGDSVPGYTPIIVDGLSYPLGGHQVVTFKELSDMLQEHAWIQYHGFKQTSEGLWDKQYVDLDTLKKPIYVKTATNMREKNGGYVSKWTKVKKFIRHRTNKNIYRVTTGRGIVDVTEDHSLISDKFELLTPKELLNIDNTSLLCHISIEDDTFVSDKTKTEDSDFIKQLSDGTLQKDNHNIWMKYAASAYYALANGGEKLYIDENGIHIDERKHNLFGTKIISIEKIGSSNGEYVYDLETEEGTFNAGIGEIVVKNTDSVFEHFATSHLTSNVHKVAYCMIVGGYVADRITEYLRSLNTFKPYDEQWTELEYEKVYLELMLLTKKRYVGSLYEFNPYKRSYIDKKGVALKRRDYCQFVHDVFKAVLKCIFDDDEPDTSKRIERAKQTVIDAVDNLLANKIPFEKLILSKLLKGRYKVRDSTKAKSFDSQNINVDDMIRWIDPQIGECTGVVRKKREYKTKASNFFKQYEQSSDKRKEDASERAELKDLDVWLKSTESGDMPENPEDMLFRLSYEDIIAKCGYEITLEKIMDPKTKEKDLEKVTQAHARLARRMYKRDPGSAPSSGSRLQFMFVQSKNPDAKQYERSEHPDYVRQHNLKPDCIYYLERQLKTPMIQLFELIMEDPEALFRDRMRKYRLDLIGQREISSFFTKKK